MPQQKDIVKIAIQMPGAYPQLIQLDQKKPLTAVIKEVCDKWNLSGPENFALQYADGVQTYITESNRVDIKNGSILRLTKAPGRCAEDLYKGIESSDSDIRCESLKQLAAVSTDITFAQEFISRDGHSLLVQIVEDALEAPIVMIHTLTAFVELMDHGIVSWENLSSVFIKKELFSYLEKKNLRQYIYKNIIHSSSLIGDEMAHYLYVLQSVRLNHLESRMRTPLDSFSQEQRETLHSLRQAVFENEGEGSLSNERRRSLCAKEFKKLGFSNNSNPGQDLSRTPPGLLALDTMAYFASRYPDAYSRFVLENSSREDKHECPFARSSIQLTFILCEILRIGEPPSETGLNYHPIFFAQDRLLEELFCICIQLLNKTWKEMRATQEDFDKVMQVVREQITRTLSSKPTSLELFKNKVNALNYSEILKLRQTERLHQEESLTPPVLELKERLKPELLELIRQQRLNRLCHGTLFRKISSRRRQDKLWYCRLSPNHKVLHYGDVDEETEMPSVESLQEKIPVTDIKSLLVGKDCPHMKENKGKQTKQEMLDLAFSITYDVEEYSLNFIASSRTDFCLWTDGLNVLLGKEMSSEVMRSELEILLSMEIKLRLLDLENIPVPDLAPPIPNPPSNFNFCYDFSQAEQ
ncbi:engulfment and cell motility protein 3 isoform X3 [Astyanax mexicanus]|uniref:engulfment and cell motility protein 3 isoform X3 n=1 Tax=Astyanax mexicanus TaxID=7994 RepID=UPI0020CAC103|nr:engulfment and cell motility protein 3 isoform X3 [Astyanax mexicanus]